VPAARQAVIDCEDELEAQKSALAQMRDDLPNWSREVAAADVEVEAAISTIFAPLAEKLIERGEQIAAELAPIRDALATLWGEPSPIGHDKALAFERGRKPLAPTMDIVAEFLRTSQATEPVQPDPWSTCRARLRLDAFAALPELDILLSDKPSK
jgi:hypothetical protein